MSRAEFASLYLQPNQQQGTGKLVDYKPLASPQIERKRLCSLTGLNGHLEASVSSQAFFVQDAHPSVPCVPLYSSLALYPFRSAPISMPRTFIGTVITASAEIL
jgi:hypothetical protein